jgi:hypothetical protein
MVGGKHYKMQRPPSLEVSELMLNQPQLITSTNLELGVWVLKCVCRITELTKNLFIPSL